jgi:hypothetical protein
VQGRGSWNNAAWWWSSMAPANSMVVAVIGLDGAAHILSLSSPLVFLLAPGGGRRAAEEVVGRSCRPQKRGRRRSLRGRGRGGGIGGGRGGGGGGGGTSDGGEERWWSWATVKASRPLIRVLVINDNHYGLTILFKL